MIDRGKVAMERRMARLIADHSLWMPHDGKRSDRMKVRENLSAQQYSWCSLLLAMILAIGSAAAQQPNTTVSQGLNPCIAGQSCFTDVTDILNGQRHLLRVDDLVIAGQFGSTFAGAILNTANSTITAARASSLAGLANGCPGALPALASAR